MQIASDGDLEVTTFDVPDPRLERADDRLQRAEAREALRRILLRHVTPLTYQVLARLYGLDGQGGTTESQAAIDLHLSTRTLCQIRDEGCRMLADIPGLRLLFASVCRDLSARTIGRIHDIRRAE